MSRVCVIIAVQILFGGIAAAEQKPMQLTIKPPEVKLPDSVPFGKYRRIIQPFENWTLICDENLQVKTRVCNITQTIIDQTGRTVFSWSVAATKEGKPYMILRTLPELGSGGMINLEIPDGRGSVHVRVDACNGVVCVGTVPIGPRLRPQITNGSTIRISYGTTSNERIEISAPLAGIKDAIKEV